MAKELLVPDIGDFRDVDVIEVLVKAGDTISVDDPLITLESDKASMDVPATEGGLVKEVKVAVGDTVSEGSLVLLLASSDEASVNVAAAAAQPVVSGDASVSPSPSASGSSAGRRMLASWWRFIAVCRSIPSRRRWRRRRRRGPAPTCARCSRRWHTAAPIRASSSPRIAGTTWC